MLTIYKKIKINFPLFCAEIPSEISISHWKIKNSTAYLDVGSGVFYFTIIFYGYYFDVC